MLNALCVRRAATCASRLITAGAVSDVPAREICVHTCRRRQCGGQIVSGLGAGGHQQGEMANEWRRMAGTALSCPSWANDQGGLLEVSRADGSRPMSQLRAQ